ncbi:MAG: DUF1566 domain-containing protein [Ketobacter sp.]|nr:DUF1566 domain-containing protein [Ketobacter sp.]
MTMIKTLNNDRNSTMPGNYLNYEATEDGYIYVAYDRRATTPPDWLTSTFTQIPCARIETSLSTQGWLDVYKSEVETGFCYRLGTNKGPGFTGGTVSNYIVMASSTNVGDQCPPPAATNPLPKTGQTVSTHDYDDGDLQRGTEWPQPRFTDNEDGTIRDNMTGLIWTEDANIYNGEPTWADALDFCNGLSDATSELTDGSEAGDWVLPNVNELASLVDRGERLPAVSGGTESLFENIELSPYWTSTPVHNAEGITWVVSFADGSTRSDDTNSAWVWCVRDDEPQ